MTEIIQGCVTVTVSDTLRIPDQAGNLSNAELNRLTRARRGLGFVCQVTADAMSKNPARLAVPGLTAEQLAEKGQQADSIDTVINDLETLIVKMKQANLLLDNEAHEGLRRVLAFVRSQEKFDAHLADLTPQLISYFAQHTVNRQPKSPTT